MTLRTRLTLYYTLFFAAALIILGAVLYLGMRSLLLRNARQDLRVGIALVQQVTTSEAATEPSAALPSSYLNVDQFWPSTLHDAEAPELYVQVADANANVVVRSTNLGRGALPLPIGLVQSALSDGEVTFTAQVASVRVLSLIRPIKLSGKNQGVIQVAQSLREIDQLLTTLLWVLAIGGSLVLIGAARGSLWLARAALLPIEQISATAEHIMQTADLQQRVPPPPRSDELGRLTHTINGLLARLERLVGTQQRFTADVAHDLRTPLAAMRGNLEILRRGAQHDPVMFAETIRDLENEVARLTRMANDLLVLTEADTGIPLRLTNVPLDEIVLEAAREMRLLGHTTAIRVALAQQVAVLGDRDRLKQALLNLLINAIQHTPSNGLVTLGLDCQAAQCVLSVSDTGHGILPAELPHIFERFYRGDQARASNGSGLGLAIVKWVAEAHGGRVEVESTPGRGTRFALILPAVLS